MTPKLIVSRIKWDLKVEVSEYKTISFQSILEFIEAYNTQ